MPDAAVSSVRLSPVVPVVDYEPPAFGGAPALPPVTALRTPAQPPARPGAVRAAPETSTAAGSDCRAAAVFADAALRRVLEVIDRRRPLSQLRPLLAAGLVDSLMTSRRADGAPARLRRVLAQMSGPDGSAAEVVANYTRGERVHAIACRIEQVPSPTGTRWQVVALHLG